MKLILFKPTLSCNYHAIIMPITRKRIIGMTMTNNLHSHHVNVKLNKCIKTRDTKNYKQSFLCERHQIAVKSGQILCFMLRVNRLFARQGTLKNFHLIAWLLSCLLAMWIFVYGF